MVGRRPVKVWNCSRTLRKALVVASFEELLKKGKEKLCMAKNEHIRIVLEADGTQV